MKTKNILKIGIFSIVLFALLISPVLKTNILQVRATSECEKDENNGECINKGSKCSTLGDYVESSFGCTNDRDDKCCIPNPTPGTVSVPQRGTQIIKTTLKEESADNLCKNIVFNDFIEKCSKDHGAIYRETICVVQASFAQSWCQIVKGAVEGLGKMFAGLINLEIEWILNALNPKAYGGFATNVGVIAIWTMLRNIVNSLLVLGLIGIAIATILGYKKYAWKQILWKLILVALLVNFSLVISGIIVDTSNYLTGYFLSMSQENGSIAPRIMEGYGYTASTTPDTYNSPSVFGDDKYKTPEIVGAETPEEVNSYSLRFGNFFIIIFVMILVGGFTVIALLSIFLTVIIRNLLLIILLGLSPIVFAAWIFPDTEKYWKMWWDNFLKWCSFPIIFAFALYLGLTAMTAINTIAPIGTTDSMAITIIRMVLFSMFLVGGLIFSLQGGGAVSQTIIKQTSKIGAAAGAFIGYKALKGATGSETYRKAQEKFEGSKFAPLHDIGIWMSRQPGKIRANELKQIAEDYKNRTPDQIRADRGAHKNDKARAAVAINELIERKKVNYEKDSEFINIAKNQSNLNVPGLKKAHPELYVDYFTKPEDMEKEIRKVQLTAPHAMKLDEAKNRARINLITKRVKEADSDAIKSGNWDNVLERLEQQGISENKGAQYIDRFFQSLWKENVVPEGYAAMFRSMDIEKQRKWAQEFVNSIGRITNKKPKEVVSELDKKNFYRNRFLTELLPEREDEKK